MTFCRRPVSRSGGKTGLPNAGTSSDDGKIKRHRHRFAGLDDSNDNA